MTSLSGMACNRPRRNVVAVAAGLFSFFGAVGAAAQQVEHLDQLELLD
jgi:hypothetical protein